MDPNFDKVFNFMLQNSGDEIRVTVWESDLNKIKNIGTKILHNFKNIYFKIFYNFRRAINRVLMNINESSCRPYGWPRP